MDERKNNTRYPYTYAADFIRSLGGYDEGGIKLSRSNASQIRQSIASIIGMEDINLAQAIADYYLDHEDEIAQKSTEEFLRNRKE